MCFRGTIYLAYNIIRFYFSETGKEKRSDPRNLGFSSATERFFSSVNFNVNNLGRRRKKRLVTNLKGKEEILKKGLPDAHSRIEY